MSSRIRRMVLCSWFVLGGLALVPHTGVAQNPARHGPTPPRLRFVDGPVSFWRPGAEDWTEAQINTAIAAGDALYAGEDANYELQIGATAFIRAGNNTALDLAALDSDYTQFRVTGGHAVFDMTTLPPRQSIEIASPNGAFTIDRPGYYRVDVDDNTTAFSARRGGAATVISVAGETADVGDNQQIVLEGTDTVYANVSSAPPLDEWDRWNNQRMAQLVETPRSAQYVPPQIAGVDDLDRYGDWRQDPRYGHVWFPHDVGSDWAPYSTGRWVYDPYYQWTWVDEAAWGWAPYHYGRWVNVSGGWGWAPGPVIARPVYSPALVAFFGSPSVGVSVNVGLPFVSWVALSFGEPVIPWWGGRGYVGRPSWGGWGGPRVVNNTVINNTTIVNVTNVNEFHNTRYSNAVMGVDRNRFGRDRGDLVRLDADRVRRLRPVRGDLKVQPVAASLAPRQVQGRRPPEQLQRRQVVATRAAPDPVRRLREKGVRIAAPAKLPEARIVRPQRGAARSRIPVQAGVRPASPEAAARSGERQRVDQDRQRARQDGRAVQRPEAVPEAQRREGARPADQKAAGAPDTQRQRAGQRQRGRKDTGTVQRPEPVPQAQRPVDGRPGNRRAADAPEPAEQERQRARQRGPAVQRPEPAREAPRPKDEGAAREEPRTRAASPPNTNPKRVERAKPSGRTQTVPGGGSRPSAPQAAKERPPQATSPQSKPRSTSEAKVPPGRRERVERTSPSEPQPERPGARERSRQAPQRQAAPRQAADGPPAKDEGKARKAAKQEAPPREAQIEKQGHGR